MVDKKNEDVGVVSPKRKKVVFSKFNKDDDFFLKEKIEVNYRDITNLKKFINRQGRIVGRKQTKLTAKNQRKLSKAIKRARQLMLIPYSTTGESL